MGRVLAIANQKGGVGKTTTCINLAASLVALDRTVLLIDLDPQGNTTMGSGVLKNEINGSVTDLLLDNVDPHEVLLTTQAGYDLLPTNGDLTVAEIELLNKTQRESRLLQALAHVRDSYDFLIIDCPPALNMLTLNALVVAHGVLVPMQCEYYALEGLFGLLETIEQIKQNINAKLEVEGLLLTMYDGRNRLTTEVSNQLKEQFPDKLYNTVIPRNVRLAEAPSHGLPTLLYDKTSVGAKAYMDLAKEILARREQATLATQAETA